MYHLIIFTVNLVYYPDIKCGNDGGMIRIGVSKWAGFSSD